MRRIPNAGWFLLTFGGGVGSAVSAGFIARSLGGGITGFLWSAALGGAMWVVLSIVFALTVRGLIESVRGREALAALIEIRPLLGPLPVPIGGDWAMSPTLGRAIALAIAETRPKLVVECGSGSSTVLIAECLRALGFGHVLSLEHEEEFFGRTQQQIRQRGLENWANVILCPLRRIPLGSSEVTWYEPSFLKGLDGRIDVLVVDGPPGIAAPRARYPAVPVLRDHLADGCVVLLDDGDRPDERAIARQWGQELGAEPSYVSGGEGAWVIRS